jgi:pimeloyl-ACP methyl ester carboxylesterase
MRSAIVAAAALLTLAGCTGAPTVTPTPTAGPSISGKIIVSVPAAVTFPAADGVSLHGNSYGGGPTAVILANMGDNDPSGWDAYAPLLADSRYRVLTFSFRYPLHTNAFTTAYAQATVPDLLGAVAYARQGGAVRVVLIGASLGGITVGKVGAQVGAAAVVIISAEQDLSEFGLVVSPAELAGLTMPKLFIASEQDTNTPYALTKQYYDNAPEPKQFHSYPGSTHGVGLLAPGQHNDLGGRLLDFLLAQAPA